MHYRCMGWLTAFVKPMIETSTFAITNLIDQSQRFRRKDYDCTYARFTGPSIPPLWPSSLRCSLLPDDMDRLLDREGSLTGHVINAAAILLIERITKSSIDKQCNFLYLPADVLGRHGRRTVPETYEWLRPMRFWNATVWFIPYNSQRPDHWTLYTVWPREGTIVGFDSMPNRERWEAEVEVHLQNV